jgi:small subunit ribosomal protein S1
MQHHKAQQTSQSKESFGALLDEVLGAEGKIEGSVLRGHVMDLFGGFALIEVGLKSEGMVPLQEFEQADGKTPAVGDEVDVYVDRYEDRDGAIVLSREKARREEAWIELEKAYAKDEPTTGKIFSRVKGGLMVDLQGAVAFLPNSQVDVRPIRDLGPLMNIEQPFQILKMDKKRGNIIVSRRAILEESRTEAREEFLKNIIEGQVVKGVVKNITRFGAFVDLGGVDGLLHVTDISWRRVNHPSEALEIGQTIEVQITKIDPETKRISLGMKHLEEDPWKVAVTKFPVGTKLTGRISSVTDYGAFVELEPGIVGLVYMSEISWADKNPDPKKVVNIGQDVDVMVLDVDTDKRRISLGMKQCQDNPYKRFADENPEGTPLQGVVVRTYNTKLLIELDGGIRGTLNADDFTPQGSGAEALKSIAKGDVMAVTVLKVDPAEMSVTLGANASVQAAQPSASKAAEVSSSATPTPAAVKLKKGDIVTCTISEIKDGGIHVTLANFDQPLFIKRSDLSRDRSEQRPDRFAKGEKIDALITALNLSKQEITLSIKAREIKEEKQMMAEYGSADSGASLGDILGPAIKKSASAKTSKDEASS